jgi:hypothetical protein
MVKATQRPDRDDIREAHGIEEVRSFPTYQKDVLALSMRVRTYRQYPTRRVAFRRIDKLRMLYASV